MALTEIQSDWLTKDILYKYLQGMANQTNYKFNQFADQLEWLNLLGVADMNAINVPAETQTLLASFRSALNGLLAEYNNNVADIIDQIRTL